MEENKNELNSVDETIENIDDNINKIESMDEKVSNEPVIVDSEEKKDEVIEEAVPVVDESGNINEEVINEQKTAMEEVKEEKQPEDKKKSKGKIIAIVLIVLLLSAGIGFFAWNYFNKEKTTSVIEEDIDIKESPYRLKGNSLEDFDLYFLKLENEEKNKVYSPLSIKYTLEMLSEGADGNTKKQIDNVLGQYKNKKYKNNEHMTFANAMFIRNTFKRAVKEEYQNNLKEKYGAEVILDKFKDPKNINNWVSNKTFKLINNLVDDVDNQDFFLVNALAIDMDWNYQIHCSTARKVPCYDKTSTNVYYNHEKLDDADKFAYHRGVFVYDEEEYFYKGEFNGQKNSKSSGVQADFNRYDIVKDLGEQKIKDIVRPEYTKWLQTDEGKRDVESNPSSADVEKYLDKYVSDLKGNYGKEAISTDMYLYTDENVKMFGKNLKEYSGTTLQYVGIMPIKDDLKDYINTIKAEDVNKLIGKLKEVKIDNFKDGVVTQITGDIPLFKYEYELDLMNDLKKLGIEYAFDQNKANLSNMVNKNGIFINKALHKSNIEFSNDGIKAAAATTVSGAGATGGGFDYLFKVPVEKIDITFNKPYMYIVRDVKTGEVWFAGTVYEVPHK